MKDNIIPRVEPGLTPSQKLKKAFDFYQRNNRDVPSPDIEVLTELEKQACYLLACRSQSKEDYNLETQINQLGGFEKVVKKMIELAKGEAQINGDRKVEGYMSVSKTMQTLVQEKEEKEIESK